MDLDILWPCNMELCFLLSNVYLALLHPPVGQAVPVLTVNVFPPDLAPLHKAFHPHPSHPVVPTFAVHILSSGFAIP